MPKATSLARKGKHRSANLLYRRSAVWSAFYVLYLIYQENSAADRHDPFLVHRQLADAVKDLGILSGKRTGEEGDHLYVKGILIIAHAYEGRVCRLADAGEEEVVAVFLGHAESDLNLKSIGICPSLKAVKGKNTVFTHYKSLGSKNVAVNIDLHTHNRQVKLHSVILVKATELLHILGGYGQIFGEEEIVGVKLVIKLGKSGSKGDPELLRRKLGTKDLGISKGLKELKAGEKKRR